MNWRRPSTAEFLAVFLALTVMGASAQLRPVAQPVRSVSGLFIAYPTASGFTSRFYRGDQNSIPTDPAVLAISAERIKNTLWRQLEIEGDPVGRIHLRVRPARVPSEQPTINVTRALTGWAYRVDIPDSISTAGFANTVIHACLLEFANRQATGRTAELPLWLAEGITQDLLATENLAKLIPPPTAKAEGMLLSRVISDQRRQNPLAHAHRVLQSRAPLTFEELSWPAADQLADGQIDAFRSSAQLLVHRLLELNQGKTCLRGTLENLPHHMNWQFAFLAGFAPHFKTQLDIEKWWALQLVQFTGRDLTQALPLEASWDRLNEIIQAPVEVRSNPRELPRRSEVSLQTIIRDWDGLSQRSALQRKLRELELLRLQVAPELVGIVDEYRSSLNDYLNDQNFSRRWFGLRKQAGPIRNRTADNAIRQLNSLDARRMALKLAEPQLPAAAVSAKLP